MMVLMEKKNIVINNKTLSSLIYKNNLDRKHSNRIKVVIIDEDGSFINGYYFCKDNSINKSNYDLCVKRAYRRAISKYLAKIKLNMNVDYIMYNMFRTLIKEEADWNEKHKRTLKKRSKVIAKVVNYDKEEVFQ